MIEYYGYSIMPADQIEVNDVITFHGYPLLVTNIRAAQLAEDDAVEISARGNTATYEGRLVMKFRKDARINVAKP